MKKALISCRLVSLNLSNTTSEMRNDWDSHQRPGGREGQTHKDYEYSPVSASITQTANGSDTLQETQFFTVASDIDQHRHRHCYQDSEMTEKGSRLLQYLGSGTGNICALAAAIAMGWSSPILPMLKTIPATADNPLGRPITEEEGSWIGSLLPVGGAIGGCAAGYLAEKFGRKNTLLLTTIPSLTGWILIATARNLPQLYLARILFGISSGIPYAVLPMYIGEIAETSIRGALGSLMQLFLTFGLLYSYAIGPYVSYTTLWIACICVPAVFFFSFITMPESPYYLLSKGRKEDAIRSVSRLRGKSATSVQKEVDEMQVTVEEAYRNQGSFRSLFTVKANFKALGLTCALAMFQQFTGINVVLFYTGDIFNSTGSQLSSGISTIIVGVVMLVASVITPLVVDKLGRKILLMGSAAGMALTLATLGLYFYLKVVIKQDVTSLSWLPVLSLVVYISTYSLGWGPLPWAVMGELFASDVKSKASSITVVICWLLAFCITKFFTNIEAAMGTHAAFWIFSVCCIISGFFVFFLLPETKGKSLQQIQDELNGIRPDDLRQTGGSSSLKQ